MKIILLRLTAASFFLWILLLPPECMAAEVRVDIRGIEGELLENVQVALTLPPGLVREDRVDERWLERFRRRAPELAARALEPFGYYQAEVETDLQRTPGGDYRLLVRVKPGNPVRVDRVQVRIEGPGSDARPLKELARDFPLTRGDVLRHGLYQEGKGALQARAIDLGYLDAEYQASVIRVNRGENRAEIDLVLETGPRYRFGEVALEGAGGYPEKFLRRYLAFEKGEVFSYAKLGQTQLNFLDSDRFREVIVTPRQEAAKDLMVPVEIQLSPSPTQRLRPGIGYGTDTGARLSLNYQNVNVFDRGHELNAEMVVAELRQSLGSAYVIPSSRNIDSFTTLRVGFDRENLDVYETQSLFAEIERTRAFTKGRRGSVFLRLLREDFTIGEQDEVSQLLVPGIRFSRRRYREPLRPTEGYSYSLEVRGAHQALLSDSTLGQGLASGTLLIPLPARFSVFLRVQGGLTAQSDPLSDIPPSLRFFAGGDRSVRGYAYQSLGPTDENGEVIGGKNLLVGSVEVERALGENWGVAAFYDAGNAFNSFSSYRLRKGAGLGARWYTPVGPVKIDLARQIGEDDPSYRLHVSIGFGW